MMLKVGSAYVDDLSLAGRSRYGKLYLAKCSDCRWPWSVCAGGTNDGENMDVELSEENPRCCSRLMIFLFTS